MKGGRSLLCFPLEFLRTLLANLVHTNDNDAAPLNVRTDAASQFHPLEVDRHHCSLTFSAEKHSLALSMITWGVAAELPKKHWPSAAFSMSPLSHLTDNNG